MNYFITTEIGLVDGGGLRDRAPRFVVVLPARDQVPIEAREAAASFFDEPAGRLELIVVVISPEVAKESAAFGRTLALLSAKLKPSCMAGD